MAEPGVQRIIDLLGLQPLTGEGGLYRETYKASEAIPTGALPDRYHGRRVFSSAIYYLLSDEPDSFSALHRLASDEIYHFYLGDPVEMLLLYPDRTSRSVVLGPDLFAGQQVQFVVSRGVWQGSKLKSGGRFALLGTTMAPGFDDADYEHGVLELLLPDYPEKAEAIKQLSRPA